MAELIENCSNCRHHSTREMPRDVKVYKQDGPLADLFEEHIETSDEMDKIFYCKAPNSDREVGKLPIYCEQYEPIEKQTRRNIDDMIKKWEERNENKE